MVDTCLPAILVEGLKSRGVNAVWVPDFFGRASVGDESIRRHLNNAVLLTRDFKFGRSLGDKAIILKGFSKTRYKRIPKEPEETINFKIKRHMRLLFFRKIKVEFAPNKYRTYWE